MMNQGQMPNIQKNQSRLIGLEIIIITRCVFETLFGENQLMGIELRIGGFHILVFNILCSWLKEIISLRNPHLVYRMEYQTVESPHAKFRFYAELNDYLPENRRKYAFEKEFEPHASIKHIIEAMGIPHTEVDLILVNGEPVDFSRRLNNGDLVSIYPVFESFDISPVNLLRPEPLREPRFILDTHLGKLASYLRMLGFDTLYNNHAADQDLAEISSREHRILLTRDRGLLMRNIVTHGHLIKETIPSKQLIEVIQRFQIKNEIQPFKRCLTCNGLLQEVRKENIIFQLQPQTRQFYELFFQCEQCGKIYWQGSHYKRMMEFIEKIISGLS